MDSSDGIVFGSDFVRFKDFPVLYTSGRMADDARGYPTDELEAEWKEVVNSDRDLSSDGARELLRQICIWSGKAGRVFVWPQLVKEDHDKLLTIVRAACRTTREFLGISPESRTEESIDQALAIVVAEFDKLYGVSTSYASKFTRFLLPDYSAVLDSFIAEVLNIAPPTNDKYVAYSKACRIIASNLNSIEIDRPFVSLSSDAKIYSNKEKLVWRSADVDLALWVYADEKRHH
jgi:hypothetical protein